MTGDSFIRRTLFGRSKRGPRTDELGIRRLTGTDAMSADKGEKGDVIRLSSDEREQLASDRREIEYGLASMASTLAKIMDLDQGSPERAEVSFASNGEGGELDIEIPWVEIEYPDGTVVCHQDPPGVCCRGPCPCE